MPKCFVQVLGTGTRGLEPGLMLFFDTKRYMFNCGEGTQRFCTEHKVRLNRIECFFLTRLSWDRIGGLPGALLTITDVGVSQVTLCGPEHTSLAAFSTRYFLVRPRLKIHIREFKSTSNDPNCAFQDENLKVFPIVIDVTGEEEEEENMSFSSSSSSSSSLSDSPSSVADFEYCFHPMSTPQPVSGLAVTKKATPTKLIPRGKISKSPPTLPPDPSSLSTSTSTSTPSPTASISSIESTSDLIPPEFNIPSSTSSSSTSTSTSAATSHAMNTETAWMQNVEEVINLRKSLPTPQGNPSTKVVCYACHTADTPGKFDMKKARSLGVTPGPNCGLLVKGQSITLPNGNVVNPSDCIAPAEPGPIFLVVECPSTRYLHSLTASAGFSSYFTTSSSSSSSSPSSSVECIFHFSPPEVLITTQYQEWMTKFGENTQHIIANDHHCPSKPILIGAAMKHAMLHVVHPQIFPKESLHPHTMLQLSLSHLKIAPADTMLQVHFQPPTLRGLNRSKVVGLVDEEAVTRPFIEDPVLSELLKKFREDCSLVGFPIEEKHRHRYEEAADTVMKKRGEFEVSFLGTGAAIPSRYRNVSSIYLSVHDYGSLLFDAGEGTYGQLIRLFGELGANQALLNLKAILISHMHADHHLGAIRILLKRQQLLHQLQSSPSSSTTQLNPNEPFLIIGPDNFSYWLSEYSLIEPLSYQFVSCEDVATQASSSLLKETVGVTSLKAVEVIHCPHSFGFVLEHSPSQSSRDGESWKIVYSGDTRPCDKLVEEGKNATLLIHEATFESELTQDAVDKSHSTTKEAMDIGFRMDAKLTVLNHFSQRYPKVAPLPTTTASEDASYSIKGKGAIAFDLMTIRGEQDFLPLNMMIPLLQQLFKEEEEDPLESETPEEPSSSYNSSSTAGSKNNQKKGGNNNNKQGGKTKGKGESEGPRKKSKK